MKISTLQPQVAEWARRNFPNAKPHQPLLGLIEEVGELAQAHLKAEQGIRGAEKNWCLTHSREASFSTDTVEGLEPRPTCYDPAISGISGPCQCIPFWHCKKMDAAADAAIFLCHYCALVGVNLEDEPDGDARWRDKWDVKETHKLLFGVASYAAGLAVSDHIVEIRKGQAMAVVRGIRNYCLLSGFALEDALETTWAEVRRRDWAKNKVDGK